MAENNRAAGVCMQKTPRRRAVKGQRMSHEELWELLIEHQNEVFFTVKGLPFRYTIKGGELFVDRREKSITRSTILKAYDRICETPEEITGPKKLNAFGAPYIWAIFLQLKLAAAPVRNGRAGAGRKKNKTDI
ncbi:MAG: hypothetical protein LUG99_12130 [Lachnospiraceae bacterium]|nr:hypothetical protein [Lachnospiraceae bacterium]